MKQQAGNKDLIEKLKREILSLQKFAFSTGSPRIDFGLGSIEAAFPNHRFPTGVVHEFLSASTSHAAATAGFMTGILGRLLGPGGTCLYISTKRTLFPPSLKIFGMDPQQIIFIDLKREKDVLWAVEEALKCESLAAVVGEINEISFTESRRLQLAVERSRVTGFLHRTNPKYVNTLACVSRWKVTPLASEFPDDMPGIGFPRWCVELLKVRNGEPGVWQMEWTEGGFRQVLENTAPVSRVYLQEAG